ncbi:MAG TPA: STAS domain-containing protein [Vicinamibacterales bacterium]|jgi:anti-anti-sigma factor|nr:STAS domain-containing protein [Vicinamibacterales bacterium]
MNVRTENAGPVSIVRVGEARLMYPLLADFSGVVTGLLASGRTQVLLDLSTVTYIDSAAIGCLMDLYRQITTVGGHLKAFGVQRRVETMLTLTGAQNFVELHPDEATALQSFGV